MGDNMRLVDADALLSEMGKYSDLSARYRNEYLSGMQQRLETCIELVDDAPTVDAVPVVRCRDCEHKDRESGFCHGRGWPLQLVPDDGFCDKGKGGGEQNG